MITYKGQKTVIGKKFIYEGEVLKYTGKIYGDSYNFTNQLGVEYILSESDLDNLKEYSLREEEQNIINNIPGKEKIKATIINYTEKELALINDILVGKSNDIASLNKLYQDEINALQFLNKYDPAKSIQDTISLDAQKGYLDELNRNISNKSIISILASLRDFINSNKEGEQDGNN